MRRAIVVVLDGCGAGEAPDAAEFNDFDHPATIKHVWETNGGLNAPNLESLGFFAACGVVGTSIGRHGCSVSYGRLQEVSKGKDSVTGHWEMMGVRTEVPFPTYPNGFPTELVSEFESQIGSKVIGNIAGSGTAILDQYGPEHLATRCPILYTSADSVFQIACHEEIYPVEQLYTMCEIARGLCIAPNNVQRIIARPFVGAVGAFTRTGRRKDYPLPPPANVVDEIGDVLGVGVVPDLFSYRGFRPSVRTQSNAEHALALAQALKTDARFIFANFEDFDMLYGHRNDPIGFGRCLEQFDMVLGALLSELTDDDLLILTADHGNDPTSKSTDHSREYVPFMTVTMGDAVIETEVQEGFWQVGQSVKAHLGI